MLYYSLIIRYYLLLGRVGTRRVTPAGYFSMHRTKKVANKQEERNEVKSNKKQPDTCKTKWNGKKREINKTKWDGKKKDKI